MAVVTMQGCIGFSSSKLDCAGLMIMSYTQHKTTVYKATDPHLVSSSPFSLPSYADPVDDLVNKHM